MLETSYSPLPHSNPVTDAARYMSLYERKFLRLAVSKLRLEQETGQLTLKMSELAQQWGVSSEVAEEIALDLARRLPLLSLMLEDAPPNGGWTAFGWFKEVRFIPEDRSQAGRPVIVVTFHDQVKNYLLELTKAYTFSLYELLALS